MNVLSSNRLMPLYDFLGTDTEMQSALFQLGFWWTVRAEWIALQYDSVRIPAELKTQALKMFLV